MDLCYVHREKVNYYYKCVLLILILNERLTTAYLNVRILQAQFYRVRNIAFAFGFVQYDF